MLELWLNFKDEKGEAKRVLVEGEKFLIGRTPDNNLQIPLGNLSRQHARIERFGDIFVLIDAGSSNGTTLNDQKLTDPIALKEGDKFNLGEVVEIEAEFVSDKPQAPKNAANSDDDEEDDEAPETASKPASNKAAAATTNSSGGLGLIFLAPVLGLFLLLIFGGVVFLMSRPQEPDIVEKKDNYTFKNDVDDDEDFPKNDNKSTPEPNNSSTPITTSNSDSNKVSTGTPVTTPEPADNTTPAPKLGDDVLKVEAAAFSFLRAIANNDPRPYLTGKQISAVNSKISQFKGASGLAENIRNAKKNSSQIVSMAQSKNLKPQFLATAALAKLGNQKGDVAATAQGMLDTLDNLSIVLGNELADDNLLVIAAFDQGVAGENLKLRDLMAKMTKEFPDESSRKIRTIWFLKDKNKITDQEFEFALRFLAIGTITQNQKDFNVQAEAITF